MSSRDADRWYRWYYVHGPNSKNPKSCKNCDWCNGRFSRTDDFPDGTVGYLNPIKKNYDVPGPATCFNKIGEIGPIKMITANSGSVSKICGHNCKTCNGRNDYAESNQSDGTYICYNCR